MAKLERVKQKCCSHYPTQLYTGVTCFLFIFILSYSYLVTLDTLLYDFLKIDEPVEIPEVRTRM